MNNFNILYLDVPLCFEPSTAIYTTCLHNILHDNYKVNAYGYHQLINHEISLDDIQIIFCSDFGYTNFSSEFDNTLKISFTIENCMPNMNSADYFVSTCPDSLMGRNYTMPTFLYYYPVYYDIDNHFKDMYKDIDKNELFNRKFASYVVSNSYFCDERRINIFDSVSKYQKVYAPGGVHNNCEFNDFISTSHTNQLEEKRDFISKFKFNLACENSLSPFYITEKILDAFYSKTIPIYYGDSTSHLIFDNNSYIDATYINDEELIDRIKEINEDKNKYFDMLFHPKINKQCKNYLTGLYDFLFNILQNPCKKMTKNGTRKRFMKEIYTLWQHHGIEVINVDNLL